MRNTVDRRFYARASRRWPSVLFGFLAFIALFSPLVAGGAALAQTPQAIDRICSDHSIPVALTPLGLPIYTIEGTLCRPVSNPTDTVVVTVHGASYSVNYWDFPYQPEIYSFVDYANAAGYATFNYDRIGCGESDHPISTLIDVSSGAHVLSQIVARLRSGALGGDAFTNVMTAGHSLGSVIAIKEAAVYQNVDGVIVTGYVHLFGSGMPTVASSFTQPAILDPAFGLLCGLDPGYLTTVPGKRGEIFYYGPTADPAVITYDEQTKETMTGTELSGILVEGTSVVSQLVNVPVISLIGRHDLAFCFEFPCSGLLNAASLEPLSWSPAAELEMYVMENMGHNLNLQTNAHDAYALITDWMNRKLAAQ